MIFKTVCVMLFALMATGLMAQGKGETAAGGQIVIGSGDSYTNYGIGVKYQYNVVDRVRLEPSFTYFLKKDYASMWDLTANVHYLFPIQEQITVYPLAGLGILGVNPEFGDSDSEFGFNLGGGVDYGLTDKLFLNAELKYKMYDNWDRLNISVGVGYKF
jgi:Opacity protein and related surface antigens